MLFISGSAPGEGTWKSYFFFTLSLPASATLCPWKHNEIFKCSTTWYIHFMLSGLRLLPTAAKVSMRGVVVLSLVKDVLSKLLGWNLSWFIKWSTTVMPSPLIQMLQTHTNKCSADSAARRGCQEGHRRLEYSTETFHFYVMICQITISEQVMHRLVRIYSPLMTCCYWIITLCYMQHVLCWGLVSIEALVVFWFYIAWVLHSGSFVSGWVCPGAETLSQADWCLGTALFPAVRFQSRIKKSLNTFVSQIKDSYLSVRGDSTARLIRTADSTPHWKRPGQLRTNVYCLMYDRWLISD